MNKNVLIGALAVVVLGGFWAFKPAAPVAPAPAPAPAYGSVSSPDIQSPYFSFGSVRQWAYHTTFNSAASTTLCSFQTPPATSTVVFAAASTKTATATALFLEWGKASSLNATTTSLGIGAVASAVRWTAVASTTRGDFSTGGPMVDPAITFAPSQYLNFKMGGSAIGPSLTGTCDALFVESSQ